MLPYNIAKDDMRNPDCAYKTEDMDKDAYGNFEGYVDTRDDGPEEDEPEGFEP